MSNESAVKISDWVKVNSSVKKVADDLGRSRPTIYKMMELFDEGKVDLLPDDVVAYFDEKLAGGESETVIKMKAKLTEKMQTLSERIAFQRNRIPQILGEKARLANDYAELSEKLSGETDDAAKEMIQQKLLRLRMKQAEFDSRFGAETMELRALEESYEECRKNLALYDSTVTSAVLDNGDTYPIKTACTIEGNRCMIIHNGKSQYLDYRFVLQVYGKVGQDYVLLREYDAETYPVYENEWDNHPVGDACRNYFIIDDLLFSAPLYYKVVGYNPDAMSDGVGHDCLCPGDFDEENTSGMCPLKQTR